MNELDVINSMLRIVRNPRINSFDNATEDVLACRDIFNEVLQDVLKQGWWFNTSVITLQPTIENKFLLSSDILSFIPVEPYQHIVTRNGKLWDTKNSNYVINMSSIKGVAIYAWAISDIPNALALYIRALCRLRAVDDLDGDTKLHDQESIYVQDALENANTAQINALQLDNYDIPIVNGVILGGLYG